MLWEHLMGPNLGYGCVICSWFHSNRCSVCKNHPVLGMKIFQFCKSDCFTSNFCCNFFRLVQQSGKRRPIKQGYYNAVKNQRSRRKRVWFLKFISCHVFFTFLFRKTLYFFARSKLVSSTILFSPSFVFFIHSFIFISEHRNDVCKESYHMFDWLLQFLLLFLLHHRQVTFPHRQLL